MNIPLNGIIDFKVKQGMSSSSSTRRWNVKFNVGRRKNRLKSKLYEINFILSNLFFLSALDVEYNKKY